MPNRRSLSGCDPLGRDGIVRTRALMFELAGEHGNRLFDGACVMIGCTHLAVRSCIGRCNVVYCTIPRLCAWQHQYPSGDANPVECTALPATTHGDHSCFVRRDAKACAELGVSEPGSFGLRDIHNPHWSDKDRMNDV